MPDQTPTPHQRLSEFYRRLALLPRAGSAEEAFRTLCETLETVEDELSGLPKQTPPPPLSRADGRMYCPLDDHVSRLPNGQIVAVTRGHRIEIQPDGTIRILNRVTGQTEFAS